MQRDPKNLQLLVLVSQAERNAIDDYRFSHRLPSRAEAVRQLIQRGLTTEPPGDVAPPSKSTASNTVALLSRARPFPTDELAAIAETERVDMNVSITKRLRTQIEWLREVHRMPLRELVARLLLNGINGELTSLNIPH